MRSIKKAWAVLLVGILLIVSGCQATPTEKSSTDNVSGIENTKVEIGAGRYVETDITPDGEDILSVVQFPSGRLSMFTTGLKSRYDSTDSGASWTKAEGPGEKAPELVNACNIIVGKDDALLVALSGDNEVVISGIKKVYADGTVEDFLVPEIDALVQSGNFYIGIMVGLNGDKFFLSGIQSTAANSQSEQSLEESAAETDSNPVVSSNEDIAYVSAVFDAETGEKLYDMQEGENAISIAAGEDVFYLADYGNQVVKKSIVDGTEVQRINLTQQEGHEDQEGDAVTNISVNIISTLPNGALYSLSNEGIHLLDPSTGEKEMVMDAIAYSFGGTSTYMPIFFAMEDGSFIVWVDTYAGTRVYRYAYDENAKTDPGKVLNIWALQSNSIVRAAVSEFMKDHPDATVNFMVALNENSAKTPDDAIQSLNTEILSGAGPDIVILDGLPAESYIQKGMLLDITGKLDLTNVYQEIITPLQAGDSLYYLPARFKATLLVSDVETLAQMDTLEKLVAEIVAGKDIAEIATEEEDAFASLPEEERPVIAFSSLDELFSVFWNSSVNGIVENGEMNTDNLRKLLEAIKAVSDKYRLTEEKENRMGIIVSTDDGDEGLSGNIMSYMMSRARAGAYTMGNIIYLQLMQMGEGQYALLPGFTAGGYQPVAMAGINANSNVQEFAVEFLQSMLSTGSQATPGLGFPITGSGLAAQLETIKEINKYAEDEKIPEELDMDTILSMLKTPIFEDAYLREIMYDATEVYCKGEIDLEAAISQIMQGSKIYLAERV